MKRDPYIPPWLASETQSQNTETISGNRICDAHETVIRGVEGTLDSGGDNAEVERRRELRERDGGGGIRECKSCKRGK